MDNESNQRPDRKIRAVRGSVLFVLLLIALNLISITLLPGSAQEALRSATGRASASILRHFGEATFDGLLLTIHGFAMEIAVECTALHFLMIFIAGVVAYPRHGVRYKLLGIALGAAALFLVNALRIAVLGLVGAYAPQAFDLVHLYLWQALFALLVVGLWAAWVRMPAPEKSLVMKTGIALAVSAAGIAVLSVCMPAYLEALTAAARQITTVLPGRTAYALTVVGTVVELDQGLYVVRSSEIALTVYSQVVFLALMAASFNGREALRLAVRTVFGLGALFLIYLGHVLLFVFEVAHVFHGIPPATISALDVVVRAFALSACLGLFLFFTRKQRGGSAAHIHHDGEQGGFNDEMVNAR